MLNVINKDFELAEFFHEEKTLTTRIEYLHSVIVDRIPNIVRVAFAYYDQPTGMLKTFLNSTTVGNPIKAYEYKLSDSNSLQELALKGDVRVIENLAETIHPDNQHSKWLLEQGYVSSLTVPVYSSGHFRGFVFFDATSEDVFTDAIQRDLLLYSNYIVMAVTSELAAVKTLLATAKSSKQFTQLRDFETGKHLDRMALYSELIARYLAPIFHLSDEFIQQIYLFAPLHDIGKIGIPDEILLKPGKLTDAERDIMKQHVERGVRVLEGVLEEYELSTLPDSQLMLNIVKYHHEFMDGSGYPAGVQGDDIPIEGRIIQVADILDALTSERPYKTAWPFDKALAELISMAERGKLDRHCVEAIAHNSTRVIEILSQYRD